jgi:cytochrome c553
MWLDMVNSAAILQESGNLLMIEGRARDERWMRYSQALADAGALAMKAAEAKNADKAFEAGSAIYDTCFNCHGRYIPRPANSLYKAPLPGD